MILSVLLQPYLDINQVGLNGHRRFERKKHWQSLTPLLQMESNTMSEWLDHCWTPSLALLKKSRFWTSFRKQSGATQRVLCLQRMTAAHKSYAHCLSSRPRFATSSTQRKDFRRSSTAAGRAWPQSKVSNHGDRLLSESEHWQSLTPLLHMESNTMSEWFDHCWTPSLALLKESRFWTSFRKQSEATQRVLCMRCVMRKAGTLRHALRQLKKRPCEVATNC